MGYDVAVYGEIVFPKGKVKTWRRATVDSTGSRAIARVFPRRKDHPPTTVAKLVKELPSVGRRGLFHLHEDGDRVKVRGLLAEDPFYDRCRQLAALFMCAAELEGEGQVSFVGEGVWVGFRVSVTRGAAKVSALSEDEMSTASRDPAIDAISAYFRVESESLPPPPPPSVPLPPSASQPSLLRIGGPSDVELERLYAEAVGGTEASLRALAEGADLAYFAGEERQRLALARLSELRPPHLGVRILEILRKTIPNDEPPQGRAREILERVARYAKVGVVMSYEPVIHLLVDHWRAHPWSALCDVIEGELVHARAPSALENLAATLDARADDTSLGNPANALLATFRLDPSGAYDRLSPYLAPSSDGSAAKWIAIATTAVLSGQDTRIMDGESSAWLRTDPRWTTLALRVLTERDDEVLYGAIAMLVRIGDPRAPRAVADLVHYDVVDLDTIGQALLALGDRSVSPVLRAEAKARKGRPREAAKLEAIARELDRSRP